MRTAPAGTWIILPAHNEGPVIRTIVKELVGRFDRVLVVDDGSSDSTAAEAKAAGASTLSHVQNLGQGAALVTGLRFALQHHDARYFITFDADGQHRVEDAIRMVELLDQDACNVVFGTRFGAEAQSEVPLLKRLLLRAARRQVNRASGLKLTDAHNGLRALDRRAASAMRLRQRGMAHATEIAQIVGSEGLTYRELAITVRYTPYSLKKGQSMLNAVNILSDLFWRR